MTKQLLFFIFITINNLLFANTINLKPFQADFIQTITNSSNKSIKYKGNIYLNKNNDILWKYKTPTIKNIYITENTLIIEEPELEQEIYTSLDNKLNLSLLLSNSKQIEDNKYSATLYDTDYTIVLNENKIRQIKYNDPLDNTIVIIFFSVKENPIFSDNFFTFQEKPNYDIIIK